MRVDLHNHTSLCNHATGTMKEYVEKAIDLGIDVYGFSEHAPMNFDPKYRMSLSQIAFYEESLDKLKEQYKDKIKILKAYEVDFIEGYVLDEIKNAKVDYLIGSVHFLKNSNTLWGFDNPEFIGVYKSKNIDTIWEEYFKAISQMAKSQLFDIVGHLDLIKVFKYLPKKDIRCLAKEALKEIKKSNMSIEINSAGLRKPIEEVYPSKQLLEEIYSLGIDITFGSDAHSVEEVGYAYDSVVRLAKDIGFTKVALYVNKEKYRVEF